MKSVTNFRERLNRSQWKLDRIALDSVFRELFAGFERSRKARDFEDRAGTDYFLTVDGGIIKVDVKLMRRDPFLYGYWPSGPALPVELWSVKERLVCGYGGDADFILWLYEDSRRKVLVRRQDLVAFINERRLEWMLFLEEREGLTQMPSGAIYTSSFVWLPFYVLDKYDCFRHEKIA